MILRSQGEVEFGWFQGEIKLPKSERILCHEARHWIYGRSSKWNQALNGLKDIRRNQVSGHGGPSTDEELCFLEKCSRVISLLEFIKHDEKLRTKVEERDQVKKKGELIVRKHT